LDSTHLKPTYVPRLLRGALNKAFVPRKGASAVPVASMSTMDAINHRLHRAQMGDFSDDTEADDPHAMD
jgi:hypothetical protein